MDPETNQPVAPQAPWQPPAADIDFDALFGGVGDGSTDITQIDDALDAPSPVEPTTAAPTADNTSVPEPVTSPQAAPTQTTFTQDKDGFFIKTDDGIAYRTRDDLVEGIREKNQNIARLRAMVEAATGADPLKKNNGAGAADSSSPASYLRDSARLASDRQKAAEIGLKTGNWDRYRDVELQLQSEYLQQVLGPYAPVLQDVGKQKALEAVSKEIPEFTQFRNSENFQKALDARPTLKAAIQEAESQPSRQAYLPELYKSAWDAHQSLRLPELLKQQAPPSTQTNPTPRMPMSSSRLTPPQPGSSTPSGMTTSAGRKALMEELVRKGVLDRTF